MGYRPLAALCILPLLSDPAMSLPQQPLAPASISAHRLLFQTQSTGGPNGDGAPAPAPTPIPDGSGFGSPPVRNDITETLVRDIQAVGAVCSFFPRAVEIGCLADQYRSLAKQLPRTGDYAPVRRVLEFGADRLDRIAEENASSAPPKRYQVAPRDLSAPVLTAPLVEIAPARQRAAETAAREVIDQMETVPLRSAENSRRRAIHFQDIAAAIESNKVLLRS